MKCKLGDLVYCSGFGEQDPASNRGHIGQIVGHAARGDRDWSVLIPGKPSTYKDGTWGAKDSWLTPIPGEPADDKTPEIIQTPETAQS